MIRFDDPVETLDEAGQPVLRWNPTPYDVVRRQVAEAIAADRDGKVRAALIELGWTPPDGDRR